MKWYYLENHPNFVKSVPSGFRALGIPLVMPKPSATPQEVANDLKKTRPDVILTTGWTPMQREPYLRVVRKYCEETSALHVFWSFEDPLHTDTWSMYYLETGKPDYVFTHAIHAPDLYHRRGIPASYLPFACNPNIHRRLPPDPRFRSDVALVANYSGATTTSWRLKSLRILLEPLIAAGYDVAIWGKYWEQGRSQLPFSVPNRILRGPIPYSSVPRVYASAKVVLGIQNDAQVVTRRTWECLASGGFLLTNRTEAVLRHFVPGKHLITAATPEETLAFTKIALRDALLRKKIGENARNELHRNHTYAHRIKEMEKTLLPYLQAKRKRQTHFVLPGDLIREIRPVAAITHVSGMAAIPRNQPYLTVGRSAYGESRVFLWFDLSGEKPNGFDIRCARLKLFMAVTPPRNVAIRCHPTPLSWPVPNRLLTQIGPPVAKEIIAEAVRGNPSYPYDKRWITLDVTDWVRAKIQSREKKPGLALVMAPSKTGQVTFAGPEQPRTPPLGGLTYYRRFIPRLEIEYTRSDQKRVNAVWNAFRG
ncbi:glycosyltransferase family protein [Staphylospora marina]|uniref:glycosyltransferase family protein n=1 Tax=Staphylospora marina TaxID=2490858 RepID=UPI0013DDD5AD|nr:glycosyltransferase [Staphylospora marina]